MKSMIKSGSVDYSIVVPVYNSERTLNELCERISGTFAKLGASYEIILVDDSSSDGSWEAMKKLHLGDARIKVIHLMRNFGQASATFCGFNHCKGAYVITLDDDLQNPPEEIPRLIGKMREGYWVVFGNYREKKHTWFQNLLSGLFQQFIRMILNVRGDIVVTGFGIYRAKVIEYAIGTKSARPFFPALIFRSAPLDKITNVEVRHDARKFGQSNYNIFKWFKMSLNLFINHSSLPLLLVGMLGMIISLISISYGIFIIVESAINPNYGLIGWNSLMVVVTLLNGTILMGIGIIGEYLRRILGELSYEKQYVIEESDI